MVIFRKLQSASQDVLCRNKILLLHGILYPGECQECGESMSQAAGFVRVGTNTEQRPSCEGHCKVRW